MPELITKRVREFRKNPTPSENILWQMLRNRKFEGLKFVRQHPIKVIHDGKMVTLSPIFIVMKRS